MPAAPRAVPVRTCIGCRRREAATELLRVVVAPDPLAARESSTTGIAIVPDPRRRAPGRGAWLHRDSRCVDLAERRRAVTRALRVSGTADLDAVREYVDRPGDEEPGDPAGGQPQE